MDKSAQSENTDFTRVDGHDLYVVSSDQITDEVFLDNNSKWNNCVFNFNNKQRDNNVDLDEITDNYKKCDCVLCINHDSMKSNGSVLGTSSPLKQKSSLRASLKCIIDKVGKTNMLFSPKSRKRSVSLTDMDRGGRCAVHL